MTQREYNKLFVGGDLSGIQKFLYNITSRHASVSLKGRSAYLSDELKRINNELQERIQHVGGRISEDDKLYCSGGKFYFITDNTDDVRNTICEYSKVVESELWEEHRGQLGINIGYVAFRMEDNRFYVDGHEDEKNTQSGVLWKYCNADFARQKNQKYKHYIQLHPDRFFAFDKKSDDSKELIVGSKHKVCALTGIEFDIDKLPKGAKYTINLKKIDDTAEDTNTENEIVCLPSVVKQIEKGIELRNKEHFKTFEQYATTDNGAEGDTYLGVLRMDVDGMGKKFIIGFPTLKDYTDFSNRATQFFERDVKTTFLKPYEKYLNVIYAGGDDLFIIGRWDKVIEFAKFIHDKVVEEFSNDGYEDIFSNEKKWCNISISGGIAIVKPKFPIAKAAELAGEAEEAAKQGEKNAFNIFGKTISWNKDKTFAVIKNKVYDEYAYVEYYKNKFVEYISKYNKDYGFSKSILHKIMLYSEIADMNIEREAKGKPKNYSYMWHISYYMTRFMEKFKGFENEPNEQKRKIKSELYGFCIMLRNKQLPKSRNLELLAVAARWAELLLKDNINNN